VEVRLASSSICPKVIPMGKSRAPTNVFSQRMSLFLLRRKKNVK
jgi:hypothetical protein